MTRTRLGLLVVAMVLASSVSRAQLTTPAPDKMESNVVKVLRTTNKGQVNQYVCKVYDIKNVNPYEIINFPELLAEAEEGMIYSFVHPDGDKGKILVTCPEYQIAYFDELIPALDRTKLTSRPGDKWILYRARNRTGPYLAALGSYYAGSQDVFYVDQETNSVLIWGVPSGADAANAALAAADVPSPQALISVTFYEAKLTNDGAFGLDYHAWKNGPGRVAAGAGVRFQWLGINRDASVPVATNGYHGRSHHGQGYFLDYSSAYFDALVERGMAKILTSTKLAVMSNETAHFATGEDILYYEVTQDNVLDRKVTGRLLARILGPHPTPLVPPGDHAIRAVNTGVSFAVTPIINQNVIELEIHGSVVTLTGYDDVGRPVLSSRQFSDGAHVRSGEELVVAGLTRERKVKSTNKIPILGSLPVLGWVFGGEKNGAEKTMVVAVVKPVVERRDSPVRADDERLMEQAAGDQAVSLPQTSFGFDQWPFDETVTPFGSARSQTGSGQ